MCPNLLADCIYACGCVLLHFWISTLKVHECVWGSDSLPPPSCQNFPSKPPDRVEPRQPVRQASVSLGLPLSVRPPRRAQELQHMRELNRHPNSLPYTKQFKWYSLELWQVLMSLSVPQKESERRRNPFLATLFHGRSGRKPISTSRRGKKEVLKVFIFRWKSQRFKSAPLRWVWIP